MLPTQELQAWNNYQNQLLCLPLGSVGEGAKALLNDHATYPLHAWYPKQSSNSFLYGSQRGEAEERRNWVVKLLEYVSLAHFILLPLVSYCPS